jgi:hypothetical protein
MSTETTCDKVLLRKRFFHAFVAGFSFSVLLASLEALHHSDVWMILQLPGFLVGASIWGVHSGGNTFEFVMVLIDGLLYSLLLLFAWSVFHMTRKR